MPAYKLKLFLALIIILYNSLLCKGQLLKSYVIGESDEITVPFLYTNGFIIVDVVFQKVLPLKFIVDTGAENTILLKREHAEMLNISYHKKITLMGSDMSEEVHAYICNGTFLQLVNTMTVRHNIIVLEKDHLFLEEYIGSKVDGILGAEFFKGMVIRIDYKLSQLTIYNPKKFNTSKLKNYHSYDLEIINKKPYLNCITEVNSGTSVKTRLLIDSGAALTALFHHNTDTLLNLSGQIVKGSLGKGLGGDIEGFSGRIHRLNLGPLFFNNLLSSFQALDDARISTDKIIRNGLIGNLLLERFDVIIDLAGAKMYLKPVKNYNKKFEFDKSGLTLFAFGEELNSYYVRYVTENSPASDADIRPGDIILKVGCFSYKWFTLRQLNKKFVGKTGKKIKLKVLRGDEKLQKEIVLRNLFE